MPSTEGATESGRADVEVSCGRRVAVHVLIDEIEPIASGNPQRRDGTWLIGASCRRHVVQGLRLPDPEFAHVLLVHLKLNGAPSVAGRALATIRRGQRNMLATGHLGQIDLDGTVVGRIRPPRDTARSPTLVWRDAGTG